VRGGEGRGGWAKGQELILFLLAAFALRLLNLLFAACCLLPANTTRKQFKARMTVKLSVAGAFHTEFMSPAVPKLSELLSNIEIKPPRIPVISNVNALPHSDDPAIIREVLSKQVTSPVLWEDTIASLINNGYEKGYEVGPGSVIVSAQLSDNWGEPSDFC